MHINLDFYLDFYLYFTFTLYLYLCLARQFPINTNLHLLPKLQYSLTNYLTGVASTILFSIETGTSELIIIFYYASRISRLAFLLFYLIVLFNSLYFFSSANFAKMLFILLSLFLIISFLVIYYSYIRCKNKFYF